MIPCLRIESRRSSLIFKNLMTVAVCQIKKRHCVFLCHFIAFRWLKCQLPSSPRSRLGFFSLWSRKAKCNGNASHVSPVQCRAPAARDANTDVWNKRVLPRSGVHAPQPPRRLTGTETFGMTAPHQDSLESHVLFFTRRKRRVNSKDFKEFILNIKANSFVRTYVV